MNSSSLHKFLSFFKHIGLRLCLSLLVATLTFVSVFYFFGYRNTTSEKTAVSLTKRLERRLGLLESFMNKALETDRAWLDFKDLPEDMVIYRYRRDSLLSWTNQFPILNDDISRKNIIRNSANIRYNPASPLLQTDTIWQYLNIGSSWYLVKQLEARHNRKVVGALEIKHVDINNLSNGLNSQLFVSDDFQIYPISYATGEPIYIDSRPVMKLSKEKQGLNSFASIPFVIWIALISIIVAIIFYVIAYRALRTSFLGLVCILILLFLFYVIASGLNPRPLIFSPQIYASSFYSSLAELLIVNAAIFCTVLYVYVARYAIYKSLYRSRSKPLRFLVLLLTLLALLAICIYSYFTFKSLILNSNINLDLYQINKIDLYTALIYLSYISLCISVALLLQFQRSILHQLHYFSLNILSGLARMAFAIVSATVIVFFSSIWSLEREKNRAEVWASEMAINRDLVFELQLRNIEVMIAQDVVISHLLNEPKDYKLVKNRILDNYISALSQDYDVSVYLYDNRVGSELLLTLFQERIVDANAIATNSSFYYSQSPAGLPRYTAMFVYPTLSNDFVSLIICMDAKNDSAVKAYASLLNLKSASNNSLPTIYSYAKYLNHKLMSFRGEYAYSTILSPFVENTTSLEFNDYVHFVNKISDKETILISRKKTDIMQYAMSICVLSFFVYLLISLITFKRKAKSNFAKNYYRARINSVLFISMLSTLILLAFVSVIFVYKRNNTNIQNLIISKINILQSLVEAGVRDYDSFYEFDDLKVDALLKDVSYYAKTDINLFSPSGKIYQSTYPEAFEKMFLGSRIEHKAYEKIVYGNRRFFIQEESLQGRRYYCMYAAIFNTKGKLIAIMSAPYIDDRLDFSSDATTHMLFIITLFALLLSLSRALTTKIVDKIFMPLLAIGNRMGVASTRALEHIRYDREDEISSLVHSYNHMVDALAESGERLALAQRDKAWQEMARQVAHEIKTPLTPIKLQIQRIIRLKQNKSEYWEEKFDSILPIIISSIDQLSDTANDFSNFAKLYSEEHVEIDLRQMAEDNISLFDENRNIHFEYIGLEHAFVSGPKPQLNRVFVNMITNAVQAIENSHSVASPIVRIALRNSIREGFYEIAFEDNGPGVNDENLEKLFTPNFTTKNSGSGLGLAICRNIINVCGGEIKYMKSFDLNGACFVITIPKKS